jgi:hypothetical protein
MYCDITATSDLSLFFIFHGYKLKVQCGKGWDPSVVLVEKCNCARELKNPSWYTI